MTEYLGIDMDVRKEDIENGDFPIYEIYEGMFRDICLKYGVLQNR